MRSSLLLVLLSVTAAAAENDLVALADGRQIVGEYLGCDTAIVRFAFGSSIQELPRSQVVAVFQSGRQVLPVPVQPVTVQPVTVAAAPTVIERTVVEYREPAYYAPHWSSGWTVGYNIGFGRHPYSGWNLGYQTGWYSPHHGCR